MPALIVKMGRRTAGLACGVAAFAVLFLPGCSTAPNPSFTSPGNDIPAALSNAVQSVKERFAPDSHMAVFKVAVIRQGGDFLIRGEVETAEARAALLEAAAHAQFRVKQEIELVPDKRLGENLWGIATLSVVNLRENPANPAEMGSQILTGETFKVLKKETNWFLVQTADHYVGWVEGGGFTNCARAAVDDWEVAPRVIATAYEERILERPDAGASPVSDVVMGSQVKRVGEAGDWFQVALADGRGGFLPKKSAVDYAQWKASRQPTPENIERTAREFLGRPYSWGCNSIRGMDCSGLTKFVFFLNGIELNRNASEQCRQGVEVPLDPDLNNLKKGDLLFFGHHAGKGKPERVDHTAIYLGDKLFIQASELVRLSSLDPASPLRDERRIKALLHARRVLPSP